MMENVHQVLYETLDTAMVPLAMWLDLAATNLTIDHVKTIKNRKKTEHPNIISKIQQPERDRFLNLMGEVGYGA